MKLHTFLTGDIQVGKSTIVQSVLASLAIVPGGFKTLGANYGPDGSSDVVFMRGNEYPPAGYVTAHRVPGRGITAYPWVFNTYGPEYLQEPAQLILMDELGFIENNADVFQRAVLATLDGDTPVFGVVKIKDTSFLTAVKTHPKVSIIEVTRDNRDELRMSVEKIIQDRVLSQKE